MIAALGLNYDQASKIQTINLNHAKEIERAKAECGDDLTGFNLYVDKVAFVRDQELKSVLTPQQFAFYTNNKSNKTWLGMDKFKFKSEGLTVKENKHELKIKGKANVASEDLSANSNPNANKNKEEFSDASSNSMNIIVMPSAALPDYHNIPKDDAIPSGNENPNPGAYEIKTYPIQTEKVYVYGSANYGNKCPQVASKKKTVKKSGVKRSAKVSVNSGSGNKVAKPSVTSGSILSSKKKAQAIGTKPAAVTRKKSSSKSMATSKSKKPAVTTKTKPSGTNNCNENTFSSGQTLKPAPNSDNFYDTTASAKGSESSEYGSNVDKFNNRSSQPAEENYFINEDSKAKFTDNEIKIKPEKGVKYKITDQEIKLKDGKYKVKENNNEIKIKDGHNEKIKSNGHETKIKSGDLKVKIKE